MRLKAKAKGQEVPLANLIRAIDHVDRIRIRQHAIEIIASKAREVIFADTPSSAEMKAHWPMLLGQVKTRDIYLPELTAMSSKRVEYDEDYEHKIQLSATIANVNRGFELSDSVYIDRQYVAQDLSQYPVHSAASAAEAGNYGYIDLMKKQMHGVSYLECHLGGYFKIDFQVKMFDTNLQTLIYGGPLTRVKGRDVIYSSVLVAIPEIKDMIKRVFLRNMGVYI